MLCRIYRKPDGTLSVLHANQNERESGESDRHLLSRVAALFEEDNPEFQAFTHHDVNETSLPPRKDRERWRWKADKVAVEKEEEK